MHEFTTMYHYFKGISEESPEKSVVELKSIVISPNFPPTEECTNDSYSPHYLEMKSSNESDSNNNDIQAVANLSYLNVDHSDLDSIDTVDAPSFIQMQPLIKRDTKDLINNLNSMKIKEEDEKEITNELKITEENYYDSNEFNKTSNDDFSNACSDALEADTSSLTPSTNSIPSSNSDNNNQALSNGDYLTQPSNRPITNLFADYLTHPSNRPVEHSPDMMHDYMNQSTSSTDEHNQQQKPEASHLRLYFKKKKSDSIGSKSMCSSNGTLKRQDSDTLSKKSVDDELLEIINDFKNNVFTINEVEELVASWKNRHDVKKSFREKQEQLQKMREEYEKIQQKMKENLKRPSPFERMKRIFTRKQEKNSKPVVMINLPLDLTGNSNFRPNSTLSLHSASSNSSSGRMSTSSQASVCDRDSGTHSDHEERRQRSNLKIIQSDNLMDNYLIPPSNPRPVLSTTISTTPIEDKRSLLSFSLSQNATSTSTMNNNSNNNDLSEHYILFPSNLPIFSPNRKCNDNNSSFSTFKGKS